MQPRLVAVRRDPLRWKLAAVGAAAAAWALIVGLALSGRGGVVRHDQLILGSLPLWEASLVFLAGWQVMLWAMMVPASLEAIGLPRAAKHALRFTLAYLLLWSTFGLAVFFFDVGVHATVNHSPWLALHPWVVAGTTLVGAGAFQASGLKRRSLEACRRWMTTARRGSATTGRSFASGLDYAARCVGANWALMLLAFALGTTSLALMAAITAAMIVETTESGAGTARLIGLSLVAAGIVVVASPLNGLFLWSPR